MREAHLTTSFDDFETDNAVCGGSVTVVAPINDMGQVELQNLEVDSIDFQYVHLYDDDGELLDDECSDGDLSTLKSEIELYVKDNYIDMRWQ